MMAAEQLDFFLAIFQPLMTVEEVCDVLDDVDHKTVAAWLEEGRLLGTDLRHPEADKRMLRVFKYSVEHFMIAPRTKPIVVPVRDLVPHARVNLRYPEAINFCRCSADHIEALVLAGALHCPRFGERSKRVTCDSLITFVEGRRL